MDSYDVVYLSSDEETPFERNQRLIQEHHSEEDLRLVQSHLSRVLQVVKEGKHRRLRIAALPEPSSIPIAVPLASSLEVSIAFKPCDLKFNIMSQESQAGSASPAPVVEAENAPFGAVLFQSTITDNLHISAILRKCGLKVSPEITVKVPTPDDRSCFPPKGHKKLKYSAWSQEHMRARALLPIKKYFKDYLDYVQIAPFQLQPNGYRILSALKSLYHI